MKYKIIQSNKFKKDLKLAKKRNFDLDLLKVVVNTLANGKALPKKYHDHPLTENYDDFRECHIKPNWLLVYAIDDIEIELLLLRTGTNLDIYK